MKTSSTYWKGGIIIKKKYYPETGQRFGHLTVICESDEKGLRTLWRCKCDCGNECVARADKLFRGEKKSCGCINGVSKQNSQVDNRIPLSPTNSRKAFKPVITMMLESLMRILNQYKIKDITEMNKLLDDGYMKAKKVLQKEAKYNEFA